MTSKLVVNTIEADTGISSVSFASSISLSSTSKFFFSDAGINIGPDTNINRPATGVLGFNINSSEKLRITSGGDLIHSALNKTLSLVSTQNQSQAGTKIAFFGANRYDTDEEFAAIKGLLVSNSGGSGKQNGGLQFVVGSDSHTHAMTHAGYVGIGTGNPASLLDIVGGKTGTNLRVDGTVQVNSNQNWNFATLKLIREASNTANTKLISFLLDGDSASATGLYDNANLILTTDSAPTAGSASTTLNASLKLTSPSNIILGTNGAQRLFVRSDGCVVIGENTVPNTAAGITVNRGQAQTGNSMIGLLANQTSHPQNAWTWGVYTRCIVSGITRYAGLGCYRVSTNNPAGCLAISQRDGGNTRVWADNNNVLRIGNQNTQIGGTGGTVVGAQTSDIRLKNNLGSVSYGLSEINQINPIKFSFKKDESNRQQIGFSAQDIKSIIPEAVFNSGCSYNIEGTQVDDTLGMDYVALVPVLVNAVKELSAKVAALEGS